MPVGRLAMRNGHRPVTAGVDTVTVEVLNRLIKENPQNMTQAIRTWLQDNSKPTS